ncbi:SLBB domain-containing protein [Gammaproteobacteria bacterium]|nr:SLBB domain-containing protein [Gammaproteobacteria bacterium]
MKFKLYISFLIISFLSISSFSQELDKAFLSSLPDDIASDLINRNNERSALEEPQYRRPSTFIEKPEPTSDRFGANIFSMMQSSLMPLNEPNFDSSYVLDFGDALDLQMVGQKSSITKLMVKRDGSINIKDIGKLYVAGLSLNKAIDLIKNKINQSFIGVEAYITHTGVRDIQIIMAGNIYNPGSYTLNGNSNIFHALSVSGGPSESGSFRSIDLIRNNKKIETVDLYQTFIFGKPSFNTRLRSGDLIFVNAVEKVVSINGAVKRPGTYEIKNDEKLSNLIFFSNGLSALADLKNIKLERILDGRIKTIPIVSISQFDNIEANDLDNILIRKHAFRTIDVQGAVVNPGKYLMAEGDSILDAIKKSGGYTKSAYIFGAVYENENALAVSEIALEKLYENSIQSISQLIKSAGSGSDFTPLISILTELKDTDASGRIVIDLNSNEDTMLIQNGDSLIIPEISNQVFIYGSIASNGSAIHVKGESLDFYIDKKGGYTKNANKKSIFVLQPNGESIQIKKSRNVFTSKDKQVEIYPGSIIYIPEEIDNGFQSVLQAQAYATILGNLGVSLASISVLKD